jgi:hypothetical protein
MSIQTKSREFAASDFARKRPFYRPFRTIRSECKTAQFITTCHYSTFNGTVVIADCGLRIADCGLRIADCQYRQRLTLLQRRGTDHWVSEGLSEAVR